MNEQLVWLQNNQVFDKDAAVGAAHRGCPTPQNIHTKKNKKQKNKKRNPIVKETVADSEIDLHELGLEEAICKVELELELAKKNNWKRVRIVHGIGEKSGGIIRKVLEQKFRSEWSSKVSEYRRERNNRGSSLAVLV